jgi:hypothetical protein
MPIEVRHDVPAGVAGLAAAMAGAGGRAERDLDRAREDSMALTRLKQQRQMQQVEIDARADIQKQSADEAMARTALQHGLDKQLQEEEFDRNMATMKEQARIQAQQWEYQYTAKQRQDIARFNNAKQAIMDSDNFSPEEKQAALSQIELQQANIQPSMMPRDPGKPIYPDGQGVGEMWKDNNGSLVSRNANGEVKLIQRNDQGPEHFEKKFKNDLDMKNVEANNKLEIAKMNQRVKLATTQIEEETTDENGNPVKKKRFLRNDEIQSIMKAAGIDVDQQPAEQQQQQQQAPWWQKARENGIDVTKADRQLPPQVGMAQAYIRQMHREYGSRDRIPADKRPVYDNSVMLIKAVQKMSKQNAT